jgi:hypothetical protein
MTRYFLAAAFVLIASLAVYGRTVAPASVALDGYDHAFETARVASGETNVDPGY